MSPATAATPTCCANGSTAASASDGRAAVQNRYAVAPNGSPLAWANTFTGFTRNTWAWPGASLSGSPKASPGTANFHRPSHLTVNAVASLRSSASSVTRTASPSTITSTPWSQVAQPVVSTTCGLPRRLANFCSPGPVVKQTAPSTQTATNGVTCGRPSALTVETQNSSAASRIRQVSSHSTATAAGSLYWWAEVVTGVFISAPVLGCSPRP